MKWYFMIKFLFAVCLILFYDKNDYFSASSMALFIVCDFFIVPIIYLIVSLIRRRKLAPGEYRVKPEGKRL